MIPTVLVKHSHKYLPSVGPLASFQNMIMPPHQPRSRPSKYLSVSPNPSLGFVLIRYGKACRYRNDCHEGRCSYSQLPRSRRHSIPHRTTWRSIRIGQESGRGRGIDGHPTLLWFLQGNQSKAEYSSLGLGSLNNFSRL